MQKVLICALFAGLTLPAGAQWLNYLPPGTPLTGEGTANLSAPVPRAANGKPDLTGTWHRDEGKHNGSSNPSPVGTATPAQEKGNTAGGSYALNIFRGMKESEIPELPAAAKMRIERTKDGKRMDPSVFCLPMGIPLNNMFPEVIKLVQAPTILMILYEVDGTYRQIYTDGRPLPVDPSPAWMGYSTAHWDGDTLVVETAGFNDKSWLDMAGHSHSEDLRVTERYTRRDFGHMDVEMTFVDPKMYSKPFSIKFTEVLLADSDILESYCNENEKDRAHLKD